MIFYENIRASLRNNKYKISITVLQLKFFSSMKKARKMNKLLLHGIEKLIQLFVQRVQSRVDTLKK